MALKDLDKNDLFLVSAGSKSYNITAAQLQDEIGGSQVIVSEEPQDPNGGLDEGTLWWDNSADDGRLYILYHDKDKGEMVWVDCSPPGSGGGPGGGTSGNGNTISDTQPGEPGEGDFWTDISDDPDKPVLKTWNGVEWVEISSAPGDGTVPGSAPQINTLTLTEQSPGGNRFTDQKFDVTFDMLKDGVPIAQKQIKGEISGIFSKYANYEPVDSNTFSEFPNTGDLEQALVKFTGTGYYSIVWPVTRPDINKMGFLKMYSKSSGSYVYEYFSPDSPLDESNGTDLSNNATVYGTPIRHYVIPKTSLDSEREYYWIDDRDHNSAYCMYWKPDGTYQHLEIGSSYPQSVHWDPVRETYFGFNRRVGTLMKLDKTTYRPSYGMVDWSRWQTVMTTSSEVGNSITGYAFSRFSSSRAVCVKRNTSSSKKGWYSNSISLDGTGGTNERYITPDQNTAYGFHYAGGLFWLIMSHDAKFYTSPDGLTWSGEKQAVLDGSTDWQIRHFWEDGDGSGAVIAHVEPRGSAGDNGTYYHFRTNNGGSTWTKVGTFATRSGRLYGFAEGNGYRCYHQSVGNTTQPKHTAQKSTVQVVTLTGNGEDYNDINVGDYIRPDGDYNNAHIARITEINGLDITIQGSYIFKPGDVIVVLYSLSAGESTRYLKINSIRQVVGLLESDPGFVEYGPADTQVLDFPTTF